MKAIVYKQYGSPDVFEITNVKKPKPLDNEVLSKVLATEVTKADCELRSFQFPVKWFWLPLRIVMGITKPKRQIMGGYFSGEIIEIGKEVSKFKKGQLVFGSTQLRFGAYGEYLCLPEDYTIIPKPKNMTFEEAAAVPLGGLNALHFMRKANIKIGESVLINGAGGSIGIFAVQIAKSMGAKVTVVDKANKQKMLLGIGADHFINYTKEDFSNNGSSYDVIFDMVAQDNYSRCIKSLNSDGRYLLGNPRLADMLRSVLTSIFTDKTVTFAFAGEKEEELIALKEMIEAGKIKSVIDTIYRPEQAAEAHRKVETEQRSGMVIISM